MAILKYKDGSDWKVASKNVAYEASGGLPTPTEEELTFSGDLSYWDSQGSWDWFITKYGDKIKTENVIGYQCMFQYCKLEEIPFAINCKNNGVYSNSCSYFMYNSHLKKPPAILNETPQNVFYMFSDAYYLEEIPDNYFDTWDFSKTNLSNSGKANAVFYNCYRLRKAPVSWLSNMNKTGSQNSSYFYNGFKSCYCLEELANLPISYTATWASNAFYNTFFYCERIKKLTFAQTDAKNWVNQVIDLTKVGYGANTKNYFSDGVQVATDEQYQASKDDPNYCATVYPYSRYNKTSAIETINSLPDTSAFVASYGGTNTIKFKGDAGAKTDGGAINTMAEEEIAVATAKGWTITFA